MQQFLQNQYAPHTHTHTFSSHMPLNWKLSFGPSSVPNPSAGQSVFECPAPTWNQSNTKALLSCTPSVSRSWGAPGTLRVACWGHLQVFRKWKGGGWAIICLPFGDRAKFSQCTAHPGSSLLCLLFGMTSTLSARRHARTRGQEGKALLGCHLVA